MFKPNGSSDTNLRRHLGNVHKLEGFLYPSQLRHHKKAKLVSTKYKRQLDNAVIEAIFLDGRSFNDFEKKGMAKFLKLAIPE